MKNIDEVSNITDQEFYDIYFSKKPVLIKGSVTETSYFKNWSHEYLMNKIGTRPVPVRYISNGIFNDASEIVTLPFNDFIKLSLQEEARSYYLQFTSMEAFFPELLIDLEKPHLMQDSDIPILPALLWIGGAGCVSPLHYDFDENFLVQVRGRKSVKLFSPLDSSYLYPGTSHPFHLSTMNLEEPDRERFPLFNKADPYHCDLNAGDILYIPPRWWHHVKTITPSISINHWFDRFDVLRGKGLEAKTTDEIVDAFQKYLSLGLPIDHRDVLGESLFIKAIQLGYRNVIEAMIRLGANANCVSSRIMPGASALKVADSLQQNDIYALLVANGAF
ncbi:Cupin-like domain-containing protein [Mucilaginibacter oryzae]|uniref:Cupin-like domain-containing protein n=1 Tax=Mucilaginibacter oryzae TaxID=468058 RepID=A0A316H8C8_9SPHI|nr:cupin-like domain-containing protein [Mucilaginibacter oryzae]PWK65253.1 Cupin-like domain-containing protein [Mucilaginibacter oryzae]